MEFSRAFGLTKTQAELDFVDVDLERGTEETDIAVCALLVGRPRWGGVDVLGPDIRAMRH